MSRTWIVFRVSIFKTERSATAAQWQIDQILGNCERASRYYELATLQTTIVIKKKSSEGPNDNQRDKQAITGLQRSATRSRQQGSSSSTHPLNYSSHGSGASHVAPALLRHTMSN